MYCSDIRREVSNIPAEETKGRIVAINSARKFVEKFKQDQNFRKKALVTTGIKDLFLFLQGENLIFKQRELVEAIAKCMEHLESQSDTNP